jgi:cytochrome c553
MPATAETDVLNFPSSQVGHLQSCDPNYAIQLLLEAAKSLPYTAGFEARSIEQRDIDRLSKMTRSELLVMMQQAMELLQEADESITAYYRRQNPEDYR